MISVDGINLNHYCRIITDQGVTHDYIDWKGHRFHFFSNEGYPLEPIHIHVRKGPNRAKFWIKPFVSLEYNYGFSSKELNEFRKVIEDKSKLIEEKWNEHFNI